MSIGKGRSRLSAARNHSVTAIALAAIVALSMVAMAATGGIAAADQQTDADIEAYDGVDEASIFGPADEVYLQDNGSGVLVYEDDDDEISEFQLGADVSEGLAHVLIADDADATGDDDVEGEFSAALEDDLFTAGGALAFEQPPELEDLDVDISGEQTEETNEFSADIYALIGDGEDQADIEQASLEPNAQQQAPSLFESASTSGEVDVTADTFTTTGDVVVDFGDGMGDETPEETFSFELGETASGYELSVTEEETVTDSFMTDPDDWKTEEDAKAALEEEYADLADELGGEATVEIHHHDFEEIDDFTDWKELEYTITYEGIDEGLESMFAEELADDPAADISQEEAEQVAAQITELEIETIAFDMTSGAESLEATWDVEINEYASVLEAFVELSEATVDDEDLFDEELEEFDTMLEAQQAADLQTSFEWDGEVSFTDDDQIEIIFEAESDTENYQAYTDELADRGVDVGDEEVVFEFTATTNDGEIEIDGEVEVGMDDLAETVLTSIAQEFQQESDELGSFAAALENADLEIAKVDADFDSETVTFEAGAKFDSTESLVESGLFGDDIVLTQIAGTEEDDGVATYVYLQNVEGEDLSEDELSEHGLVDDETTVYDPGEGDREFAEMDTDEAAAYLGVDLDGDSIPGFGPVVVFAGMGAALVLFLTRRN
ncbi:hypothetical protein G6M89_11125 [Natronolimnobius sp. AArcel1]|uniref:hypothetical protein n=1 Tax=Natronolimnobius sp. AArcel1 TaxID=1679093 RepID=UPI0013EC191B|nr:hypothetical protein [Natronolimnobius sp. AArcel1]NGM69549.1 hypothetical protein [Natronolimnobius sp. AArcel1]